MLISLAVDYRHANVATRERFHLSDARIAKLYAREPNSVIRELVCVSTCNRSEIYAWAGGADPATPAGFDHAITALARAWMGSKTEARALLAVAKKRGGLDVARRILRISSGLDSQVMGDGQILGQLRESYRQADAAGTAGSVLHRLFDTAMRTGKRVAAETGLHAGRRSVGAEAAAHAHQRFGNLAHARVVVVGCGKTGQSVARQLQKLGARDIVLINRSMPRALTLADEVGGRAAPYEALHVEVAMSDVAIAATAASEPVVMYQQLRTARENCGTATYPLLLLDLSMPRNVDPALGGVPGVTIADLDALHIPVLAAEELRKAAVPAAEALVEAELESFVEWVSAAAAREAIRPLAEALTEICRRELTFAAGDEVAEHATSRIVAKLLARPMTKLRTAVAHGEALHAFTMTLDSLFAGPAPVPVKAPRAKRRAP
ncbi:glutamyl-tRNA reductase [Pseudogemmatithrix spongiicola]|uniref:Glutamyl-tRNA reductase n=1 Tax=Pseudogemmatithrix spongiicola TaxID=3062599 RepID=A0AA49JRZ0_9BACT|nr:glutamyl-tRNA reductase [Gemmatimonadaceae bacterium 'strain 138']WKW13792.1 glutamyl-tRNA reductase [Gemmatimonadaceae bacterium 'strain 318']